MEEGWERPPHAVPTRQELTALVAAAFPSTELERYELLTTGLANTNLRFWLRGHPGSYVMRLYTRDSGAVARENALIPYLARHAPRVPVPEFIYAQLSPIPCSIWRFVEGELLQDLFLTASPAQLLQIANVCGQTLAELHGCRFERCGELGADLNVVREYGAPSAFVPQVIRDGLAGLPGQRLGPRLSQRLTTALGRTEPLLREVDGDYRLVHADYKRPNLLLTRTPNGFRVAAVLDWEFAFAGPPLVDIGLFLRAGSALPAGFARAFAAGYQRAGGNLPAAWLALSRLVDLLSQMTFLDGPRERPRVWQETRGVVQETVDILEAL